MKPLAAEMQPSLGPSQRPTEAAPAWGALGDWIRLLRPQQWAKNVFVLLPLVFSHSVLTAANVLNSGLVFLLFCLVCSAVYIFNDLIDRRADRLHPRKRHRPLASGRVSPVAATMLSGLLLLLGLIGSALLLPVACLVLLVVYVVNSVLYCLWLKNHVIVDVMLIAVGFVVRLLAGCAAIRVEPSSWLLVSGFSLALMLGFGKRRTEVVHLPGQENVRSVLQVYTAAKLDTLLAVTTALTLLAYMLYTVSPETVARHGTANLIYTVPFVAYGLFRYLFKTQEGKGDGPTEILLNDPIFCATGLLWGGSVIVILYLLPGR
jgi:4-hydroxybenzoate polyprenyltransferase